MTETLASRPPNRVDHSRASKVATALAVCAAMIGTVAWRVLTFTGFNNDHNIYLAGAQQMLLGEWPVRDFVDPGWPLMYSVSAIARALFGRALLVELLLVALALAIGAAFTLVAARRLSGSLIVALAVTFLEVIINPRSFGYPKILMFAAAGWMLISYSARPSMRRGVLLGVLTACAFLFRHDEGLYVGAGSLSVVVLSSWREGVRTILARLVPVLGAIAALLVPWAVFVQYNVGLVEYFRSGLEFSRAEAEATRLGALPTLVAAESPLSRTNSSIWLFYLFYVLPLACLSMAWWRARRDRNRWSGESAAVVALALMTIVINAGFLRAPLIAREPDAIVPAALLGSWLIGITFTVRRPAPRRVLVATSMLALVGAFLVVASVADFSGELNRIGIANRKGTVRRRMADLEARLVKPLPERDQIPSRISIALMPFYEYLQRCTLASDRILMTGISPDVYVLGNRGFAGGSMWLRPGFYSSPRDQAQAIARMRAQSVPLVVFDLEEEGQFRRGLGLIAAYVDQHYEAITDLPVPERAGLRLLVERGRRPTRVDTATGWPCFVSNETSRAQGRTS